MSRILFSEAKNCYSSFDSGNFALGAIHYSLHNDRPHIPGYYLHIQSIKMLNVLTGNSHTSMLWLSYLYSAFGISLLYLLLIKWFSERESLILCLLTLTNPLIWFYGCVAEIYAFDLFLSILLIYVGLSRKWIYLTPSILTISFGVRQSSGILLLPVFIYLWVRHIEKKELNIKYFIVGIFSGLIFLFAWLIPMLSTVGGIKNYINDFTHFTSGISPVMQLSFAKKIASFLSYGIYFGFPLIFAGIIAGVRLIKNPHIRKETKKNLRWLLFWWVLPSLLFFIFVHYSKGYFLIITGGIFLFIGVLLNLRLVKRLELIALAGVQILLFIFLPYHLPSPEINFESQRRSLTTVQIFKERMFSAYLMGWKHIQSHNSQCSQLDSIIRQFKDNPRNIFYIDASVPVSQRVLQARYPNLRFSALYNWNEDSYFIYENLAQHPYTVIKLMLDSAIIITSKSFPQKYLNYYPAYYYETTDFIAFSPDNSETEAIAKRLKYLYNRVSKIQ